MSPLGPRLLIADDNPGIREMLDLVLSHRGFQVVHCSGSWDEVLAYVRVARFRREPDILIVDLDMPGFDRGVIDRLRACVPGASIVIHTGYDERHVAEELGDLPLHVSAIAKGSVRRLLEHLEGIDVVGRRVAHLATEAPASESVDESVRPSFHGRG
jgi:CheY-like chemotaxis protein